MTTIFWLSPCGSWGECQKEDLLIIDTDDMTSEEIDALGDAEWDDNSKAMRRIIMAAHDRISNERGGE